MHNVHTVYGVNKLYFKFIVDGRHWFVRNTTKMQMYFLRFYIHEMFSFCICEKINTFFLNCLFFSSLCVSHCAAGASATTTGEPVLSMGSRQYFILCTRRLSLFLKRLEHPPQTTFVDSEWTLRMCIVTRFLA